MPYCQLREVPGKVFERAAAAAPAVIFFDEIEVPLRCMSFCDLDEACG